LVDCLTSCDDNVGDIHDYNMIIYNKLGEHVKLEFNYIIDVQRKIMLVFVSMNYYNWE
jgi:hypothetical protein